MFTTTLTLTVNSSVVGTSRSTFRKAFKAPRRPNRQRFFFAVIAVLAFSCVALLSASPMQAQNTIHTVAGGGLPVSQATAADVPSPSAAVEDAQGNVYISTSNSYYIFKVTPAGALSVYAGTGIAGGSGDNHAAIHATLGVISAMAINSKGDLYLADRSANRIRCILAVSNGCGGSTSSTGSIVTVVDASGKNCFPTTAACGDGGPAIDAHLSYAGALFVDSSNNLWISDTYDYRIRCVIGASGGCFGSALPVGDIVNVAGTGVVCDGPELDCGNTGPALQAKFDLAGGIAVDAAGNLYISDTRDFAVRKVDASTQIIDLFAGNGNYCTDPLKSCGDGGLAINAHVWNAANIAFDSAGDLYIADSSDNRIRCVVEVSGGCGGSKLAKGYITTVAGDGVQGFSGDTGLAKKAELNLPNDVFVNSAGKILITDTGNQRIREVASATINTIAGGGPDGDGGAATSATLADPNTVAWDSAGNYYIADSAHNEVRQVTPAGVISTIAGTGIAGPPNTNTVLAVDATLNSPSGLAIDASNNIYIADTGNQVIREVVASTGNIVTVAGNGRSCTPSSGKCGDGLPATSGELTFPTSVALDSNGNLFIADYYAHKTRKVNTSGIISTVAGTGVRGFTGNDGPATKAKMGKAYGVAVDSSGNVYIADSENSQIRCVIEAAGGCGGSQEPIGNIIAFAFDGKKRFFGDGGSAKAASMNKPFEVAVDSSDNVFVGGGADNVVRRIDAHSLTIETVAGNPLHPQQSGFSGDGGLATQATLDNIGLAVDGNGNLLIADAGNNRVREVTLAPVITLSKKMLTFPNESVGRASPPMPLKLTNSGFNDLPISGEQITGFDAQDFSISSNTCGAHLAPAASCTINLVFKPSKTGKRTAKLVITDSLGQQTVSLVGTGQ
jgi:trimeric autotransporter adhesin